MKCNACFVDNVNEAEYCKNCGKSLRQGSSRTVSVTIPVVLGIGIFIAAIIICGRKISPLTAVHKLDESQFTAYESKMIQYYDEAAGELVVKARTDKGFEEYREKMKSPDNVQEGRDCALVQCGNRQYFVTAKQAYRLKNATEIQIAEFEPVCAYLNSNGELIRCTSTIESQVADNVLDFVIAADGDLYYYRDDMSNTDENGKVYDKNSVYLDNKLICSDSTDDPLAELICANSYGVYFRTAGGSLMVSPRNENEKKYEFTDFQKLILVSTSSIIAQKDDGNAYIWKENNDEILLSEEPVTGVVVPDGYAFTGDVYGELIFTTYDGAFYADQTGKHTVLSCKSGHDLKTAGDCTYLYWLDENNTLYRTDASGRHKDRICGKNVSLYAITEDARTAYYISGETLYAYDGVESNALCKVQNAVSIRLIFDNIIISTSPDGENFEYFIYNGRLTSATDKEPEYIDITRFGAFYILNNEVYMYAEDGKFKTWEQMNPAEQDDADSSSETETDGKKKPKED